MYSIQLQIICYAVTCTTHDTTQRITSTVLLLYMLIV